MGDSSQLKFLNQVLRDPALQKLVHHAGLAVVSGAALEGSSMDIINLLRSLSYEVITTDIAPARGVDLIWDLQKSPPPELVGRVKLFVSCSVLEHVPDVASASQNMLSSLSPAGLLYVSVPWVWRYHKYADDYHRFHASTINHLFPRTRNLARAWSTSPDCKLHKYSEDIDQKLSKIIDGRKFLPYLMLHELRCKPG